jgi:hypothetical protein
VHYALGHNSMQTNTSPTFRNNRSQRLLAAPPKKFS